MKLSRRVLTSVSLLLFPATLFGAQEGHCPVVEWGGNGRVGDLLGGGGGSSGGGGRSISGESGPSRPSFPTNPAGPDTPQPLRSRPAQYQNPVTPSAPTEAARPNLPFLPLTPLSAGAGDVEDPTRWELWWSFNRDPYLSLSRLVERRSRLSGEPHRDRMDAAIGQHAMPVLREYWRSGGKIDVIGELFLATARIGTDRVLPPDRELTDFARFFLAQGHPELQRSAIFGLGIAGDEDGVELLVSIMRDDEEARALMNAEFVSERHRAGAAYSLGLLGAASPSEDLRRTVAAALIDSLESGPLEVRVACVLALGHVPLALAEGEEPNLPDGRHLCGADQIQVLGRAAVNDEDHPWIRAHAATALGRCGSHVEAGDVRRQVADTLVWLSSKEADCPDYVRHAAVIGLGCFASAGPEATDLAVRDHLRQVVANGDDMSKRLGMMALAKVSARGRPEREEIAATHELLLGELARGKKTRKPWAALALGVLSHELAMQGRVPAPEVHVALREDLRKASDSSSAAALCMALALVGQEDPKSQGVVLRRFHRSRDEVSRAFATLSVAMLSIHEAKTDLLEAFDGGAVPAYAVPLRLLGESGVTDALAARIDPEGDPAAQKLLVQTLGLTHDPAAVQPLAALAADADAPHELRAAAVAAIGELGDPDPMHWTAPLANDVNYDLLTWTLRSPSANGSGVLDDR